MLGNPCHLARERKQHEGTRSSSGAGQQHQPPTQGLKKHQGRRLAKSYSRWRQSRNRGELIRAPSDQYFHQTNKNAPAIRGAIFSPTSPQPSPCLAGRRAQAGEGKTKRTGARPVPTNILKFFLFLCQILYQRIQS